VLKEEGGDREIRVGVKTYVRPAKVEGVTLDELTAERAVATDIATRFRKATNLIFFNSRGLTEEIADLLNERCKSESWPVNPFRVHHGSLSKDLREATEAELKSDQPITALCTRTLEMGIDIGAVQCVGQVGAPWTVASLIQRVGRSGRREGEAQMLRFYVIDAALTDASTFSERLEQSFALLGEFVPALFGALVILFAGYLVAKVVEKGTGRLLRRMRFNQLLERGGVLQAVERSGSHLNPAKVIANLL
jgi:ATP-dependent Lhr-like helicase